MTCVVCLEEIVSQHVLECSHQMHSVCLLEWVCAQLVTKQSRVANCPVCRTPLSAMNLSSLIEWDDFNVACFEDKRYAISQQRHDLLRRALCEWTRREVEAFPTSQFVTCTHRACPGGVWQEPGAAKSLRCAYCAQEQERGIWQERVCPGCLTRVIQPLQECDMLQCAYCQTLFSWGVPQSHAYARWVLIAEFVGWFVFILAFVYWAAHCIHNIVERDARLYALLS
jgi:hypothetical protein